MELSISAAFYHFAALSLHSESGLVKDLQLCSAPQGQQTVQAKTKAVSNLNHSDCGGGAWNCRVDGLSGLHPEVRS